VPRAPLSGIERSHEVAKLGGGSGVELLPQEPFQFGELTPNCLRLARRPQQADQILMALLTQGIGADGAAGIVEGTGNIPLCFQEADELGKGAQIRLRKALSLLERPLVIAPREQLPSIPVGGHRQIAHLLLRAAGLGSLSQCRFEGSDVRDDPIGVESHGEAVGDQHGATPTLRLGTRQIGGLQALAEEGDGGTQGCPPGGEVGVGPEHVDQGIAGMGAVRKVGQVGK
jgi:hypothetical protein